MATVYHEMIADIVRAFDAAREFPTGGFPPLPAPDLAENAPVVLIFSPHPDDECTVGALPLRLMREMGMRVHNVALTLGSNRDRRRQRRRELEEAMDFLGFSVIDVADHGLEQVTPHSRAYHPDQWATKVDALVPILRTYNPRLVLLPHEREANTTHMGSHLLVVDALRRLSLSFSCLVAETEFWSPMEAPNLMVETSPEMLGDLVSALSFHAGEIQRNPYHLRLPAWMQDNVRRGAEVVGKQGCMAPDFIFATLYRLRRWEQGHLTECLPEGRFLPQHEDLNEIFG